MSARVVRTLTATICGRVTSDPMTCIPAWPSGPGAAADWSCAADARCSVCWWECMSGSFGVHVPAMRMRGSGCSTRCLNSAVPSILAWMERFSGRVRADRHQAVFEPLAHQPPVDRVSGEEPDADGEGHGSPIEELAGVH